MNGPRQNTQRELARAPTGRGEAPTIGDPEAEPVVAMATTENPAATTQLMEEVCERENLVRAWQRVRENKGAPGVDGMTIDDARAGEGFSRRAVPPQSQIASAGFLNSRRPVSVHVVTQTQQ
jgi:hypothetical protein